MNRNVFFNLPIRYKLLLCYSVILLLSIGIGSITTYYFVKKNLEHNIESELKNSTNTILNMVNTSASVSIKNYLRAVAETNREIANYFYQQAKQGNMTTKEAKDLTKRIMLSQKIGPSGYIYCLHSNGIVVVHPQKKVMNTDVSDWDFAKQQKKSKEGYYEYKWKNPNDKSLRPKAVYWNYFAPWDWIISASCYRNEFSELVNVNDFRKGVLSLKFGKTGYSYIADTKGNIILHPKNHGNIFKKKGVPHQFFYKMLKEKSGKITYFWKNPGEKHLRKKLVIFNYIPEYKWIVASSSYMNEFYAPLKSLRNIVIITALLSFLLALPIVFRVSSFITNPLKELIKRFDAGSGGDLSVRMYSPSEAKDEIGRLIYFFNVFMEKLEGYSRSLKQEIQEHLQVKEALHESEEKYRSFMEAVPDPVIVFDEMNNATYLNPAFMKVFGWSPEECLRKNVDRFSQEKNWPITRDMIEWIRLEDSPSQLETQGFTKHGDAIDLSVRGAVYKTKEKGLSGNIIILRDITEAKWLERKIMEIGDRERLNVGQDLHDDLCPHLIGIESLCKATENKLREKHLDEYKMIVTIRRFITEAIEKTRQLSRGLCPVHLVEHGLESSLKEIVESVKKVSDIVCRFHGDDTITIQNNTTSTHLFRIVQESVNNALKHSNAKEIAVSMQKKQNDKIVLEISDDGQGFSPANEKNGMGLKIMRFRAKLIGADFLVNSRRNLGTTVQVSL